MLKQLFKNISKINKSWDKTPFITKLLYFMVAIMIIYLLFFKKDNIEGFEDKSTFIVKKDDKIYDDFYVDVYDKIYFDEVRNDYEIGRIIGSTDPTSKSIIADIGCKTGHIAGNLNKNGYNAIGVDKSKKLIAKAKESYPDTTYKVGDPLKSMLFQPRSLTHITCLGYSIYEIKNKSQFFMNCFNWLMPGGYLVVHLLNKELFDPIHPIGKVIAGVDPQKYSEKRITKTVASFDNYHYSSNFENKNNETSLITELFKHKKNNAVIKNIKKLHMPSQRKILTSIKDAGFIMHSKYEMKACGYENQFIYVFTKPQ